MQCAADILRSSFQYPFFIRKILSVKTLRRSLPFLLAGVAALRNPRCGCGFAGYLAANPDQKMFGGMHW